MAIGISAFDVEIRPLSKADPAPLPVSLLFTLSCKEIAAVFNCLAGTSEPWDSNISLA